MVILIIQPVQNTTYKQKISQTEAKRKQKKSGAEYPTLWLISFMTPYKKRTLSVACLYYGYFCRLIT